MSNKSIADCLDVNINTVKLCLGKFKKDGISRALFDDPRSGRKVEITDDAVAWIIDIACQRPADLGDSQELWTLKNLHCHIQSHAEEVGYPRLASITKPMVQKIMKRSDIKPFKIKYYCEKPGIQAIATTREDLSPSEENRCVYRDYEYKWLCTLSLLAGIDLLTGQAIPVVSETHKSSDFICLLKEFDEMYPEGDIIRIVCDNHSAHKSKEVQNYIAARPEGRLYLYLRPRMAPD